ncbi:MAG: nitroreductase family protein [Bacteroidaceae bacterium]|nr:nitroreductase family protein [Bacteroidaceae bacterium]
MIENRRSIRKYKDAAVEDALLNRLLTEAERTQTMGNLQLYSVVVTRDKEMKARLAPLHFNQPMVTQAPVVLTFCADFNRTTEWCRNRKAMPGYDNFLSFFNAASDALLYCQNFCTLAEAEGLGLCYLGTTIYMPQQIIDVLKLPKLVFPVATITIGWPNETPPQTDRLPLSAIRHNETYQPVTSESIDRDYTAKENLPENQEFLRINNKETLAQIFTDIRYTKKDNEAMSKGLFAALRHQGFIE